MPTEWWQDCLFLLWLLMATWRTLIIAKHWIKQPIGPSAGYDMWTTFYDLDLWSREDAHVLGPPELTPEHSIHHRDWVIWQPLLLLHWTGDHSAHCITRFTSSPLIHYSGSQHHPPFYVDTQDHECLQDELDFLNITFRENGCSQRQSLRAFHILERVA
jgi:hypothetical protein